MVSGETGTEYGIYGGTEAQNMRSMGETEAQHVGSMGEVRDSIWGQWGNRHRIWDLWGAEAQHMGSMGHSAWDL